MTNVTLWQKCVQFSHLSDTRLFILCLQVDKQQCIFFKSSILGSLCEGERFDKHNKCISGFEV